MIKNTGIPTVYNGVQFRSRLEARWAAFFDLCRWSWRYEPLDLPGYIPDFVVYQYRCPLDSSDAIWRPDQSQFAFIEVKPADALNEEDTSKALKAINSWCHSGNPKPQSICIVGNGPFSGNTSNWFRQLGWVFNSFWCDRLGRDRVMEYSMHWWNNMHAYRISPGGALESGALGDVVSFNSYHDEEFIIGDKLELYRVSEDSAQYVDSLWAKAGNVVQWKGRQNNG